MRWVLIPRCCEPIGKRIASQRYQAQFVLLAAATAPLEESSLADKKMEAML
jgi:hypothetical protein